MDRSPGFGSTPSDFTPISDSLSLRLRTFKSLTLLRRVTRRIIMQKARCRAVLADASLQLVVGTWFQVLLTPLTGVLFTFPSRYWFTIGHLRVFSLGGWSPHLRAGFLEPRPTQTHTKNRFAYGAITRSGWPSQNHSATVFGPRAFLRRGQPGYSAFARHYLRNLN